MTLSGKKILFLSPNFFGYEKAIQKSLADKGAILDFFNERPSDSALSKGIIRVKKSLYQKKINLYYRQILDSRKGYDYDFFLLIKGESIPYFFLKEFRQKNPKVSMIFYSYDAVSEYPKSEKLYPYFDENFTFEPSDALKFKLHFRPLFFLEEYKKEEENFTKKFDISFIGSAHTDRYLVGEKVRKEANRLNLKTFLYYYAPGKAIFRLKKIFDKNLQKFDFKKLSFKKLSHEQISEIYEDSLAVLDINKPFQKGLTMRTFEALASEKKIITTNADIVNYPFYSSQNVKVIKRDDVNLEQEFFEKPFKKLDEDLLEKMSLDSWIDCLFIQNQDKYWNVQKFT